MIKVHIACGDKYKTDWINTDINPNVKKDMFVDMTKALPFEDGSVDLIYSEHSIEHITAEEGRGFIRECWRVLKKGGVLRIATPDLQEIAQEYLSGNWIEAAWLREVPQGGIIECGAEFFNTAMRDWDHKFLYDSECLTSYIRDYGFGDVRRVEWDMQYETRIDSKLIIEGIK